MKCLLPRRISKVKLVLVSAISIYIFITEVAVYHIQSWRWIAMPTLGKDEIRVLFVADPQLIGHERESQYNHIGLMSRLDADRFLSKTFNLAYSYVKPHVVVFLGDLLDEGAIASDYRYKQYTQRFYTIFAQARNSKMIIVHGDNDVGGEEIRKTEAKVQRYEKYFGSSAGVVSEGVVDFVKLNYDYPDRYVDEKLDEMKRLADSTNKRHYKIIVNHFGILRRPPVQIKPVLDFIVPNMFFAAHEHTSLVFECEYCYSIETMGVMKTKKEHVLTIDMKNLEHVTEIIVPTCSYRMGRFNMGYGVAVIGKSGIVKYTILWLPNRLRFLYLHFFVLLSVAFCMGAYFCYQKALSSRASQKGCCKHARLKSTKFSA